ncbi:MAG: metal ABC transporter substrate-binding protein [Anaerolineales bacterium]
MSKRLFPWGLWLAGLAWVLSACSAPVKTGQSDQLHVVATTTIVGDVVRNIGGDAIQLDVLLPPGSDPHSFDPTPQDVAKVANADLIFANGAGLEVFLTPLLKNADSNAQVVYLSDGIQLIRFQSNLPGEESGSGGGDPHTWFDPQNVKLWVQNIEKALIAKDPGNSQTFDANAKRYTQQLNDLDSWIQAQVGQIPPGQRKLVTDHEAFTYFAARYGFQQVGAIVPGYSTLAQPSAQELAALEDAIHKLGVKAVFVGETVNPKMAERVAQDTGVKLVYLYTGALSDSSGPASTYLDFMRYDVNQIVSGLK